MKSARVLGYHEARTRIRFGETDRYGMLWHGHAPALFESARADLARRFGLGTSELLKLELAVPMVELSCEYKKPAYEEEELLTQISLVQPPMRMPFISFLYRAIKLEGGQEVLRGRTRQLLMQADGKLLTRAPDAVQGRLEETWGYLGTCPQWPENLARELLGGTHAAV
jgi:acyl-CoA thioester hydrolase